MPELGPWGGRIHASTIRVVVLGAWLVILTGTHFEYLAILPPELSRGFGIGTLLIGTEVGRDLLLSRPLLLSLKWLGVLGCAAAIFLPRTFWLTPAVFLNVLLLDLLNKSFGGYTNHSQFGILIALLVFSAHARYRYASLPDLMRALGIRGRRSDRRLTVSVTSSRAPAPESFRTLTWLIALGLVLPYTYVAANRILSGGVTIFLDDSLPSYVASACLTRPHTACRMALDLFDESSWARNLLKLGFAVTTVFELGAVGALLSHQVRRIWLPVICAFHVGAAVTMNVVFWENVVLALAVFSVGPDLADPNVTRQEPNAPCSSSA